MSDQPLYLPATFGDESYEPDPRHPGSHVHATFRHDAEMTWHAALLSQLRRREVKYAQFRAAVASLPVDLVNRVRTGMSQALVSIVDDREHMARAQALVAVPFMGRDAARQLPLRTGDILVTKFDELAIRQGLVSPHAIVRFIKRGVNVYSASNLHAKVLVFGRRAIVGSANALHSQKIA